MSIIAQRINDEFKSLFKRLLNEGKTLPFEVILERVTNYLEIACPDEVRNELKKWFQDIAEHTYLKNLIGNGDFEELIFFGQDYVTKDGVIQEAINLSQDDFILAWTQLALIHHIEWNHAHPFASFAVTLNEQKTRVTLIHPCCSPDQQVRVFVRLHSKRKFKINDFCSDDMAKLIQNKVMNKENILVIGATQSGKTTLLRAMIDQVNHDEHVVILEDTHEITRHEKRTTSLLADANDNKRTLAEYCAMALRMSPDRIVLGEIRSKEVVPLILAFNSGHRGGMSSLHADSIVDGIERLALLFHLYSGSNQLPHDKVMELVCRNIDTVILVKDKKVTEIAKIVGSEQGRCLYETLSSPKQNLKEWWQQEA